jgi:hypothetical protein
MFNPFKKGGGSNRQNALEKILTDFAQMGPNSVNCSLLKLASGEETDEDLDRAFVFRHHDDVLIQNKAFYISTPEAEDESKFTGKGEIVHLWFLHKSIPHTVDCKVMGRVRFPENLLDDLAPRIPSAYMLRPVGNIRKQEKRQFLRYSHKAGGSGRRVYSQILFDLYVTKTYVTFPDTGALPPKLADLHTIPFSEEIDLDDPSPEDVVKFMKNSIRLNPRESRVVYVGKPFMEERTSKVALLDLGSSDVLGLETSKEESRQFYIRKPPAFSSDKKDPTNLANADTITLSFHTRVSTDAPTEYYDLISEVTRIGTENLTVRTDGEIRKETGYATELADFSIGGIKMDSSKGFLEYVLGDDYELMDLEEQLQVLENTCYVLNFYPKLRFTRETEIYQPDVPMRIQILAKIVRVEVSKPKEEEGPEIEGFGFKFYYDPAEYSRDTFEYDRWELIRDFKENKHFREIHNSMNGLIAYLESQTR